MQSAAGKPFLRFFYRTGNCVSCSIKRLFQELIRIAEENPNLIQLELDFIEGNNRARALYEKMGFRVTGVKPDAIRLKDGTLLNEYSMIREIRR